MLEANGVEGKNQHLPVPVLAHIFDLRNLSTNPQTRGPWTLRDRHNPSGVSALGWFLLVAYSSLTP